mmetsp:Transcript_40469/g.53273  ORF Transcript_40469/g.53273 Transcript_40469/m.53273 type:complete len:81 (-) Transcript_40469:1527-1769(-)
MIMLHFLHVQPHRVLTFKTSGTQAFLLFFLTLFGGVEVNCTTAQLLLLSSCTYVKHVLEFFKVEIQKSEVTFFPTVCCCV